MIKKYLCAISFSVTIFIILFFLSHANSEEVCDLKNYTPFIYNVYFQDPTLEYEYQSGVPSVEGVFWLSVKTNHKDESQIIPKFELWKIGRDGEKENTFSFNEYLDHEDKLGEFAEVKHMTILEGENLAIILDSGRANFYLIFINKNGEKIRTWSIKPPLEDVNDWKIEKIIPINKQEFFLIGSVSEKPFIVKRDFSGTILWQKILDNTTEGILGFSDGKILQNKELVLLGNGETKENSLVSVSRYDFEGKRILEKSLAGRLGNLSVTTDEGYAIAYSQISSNNRSISLRKLGPHFNELWNNPISETETEIIQGFIPSKLAYSPDAGFLIATLFKNFKFFISHIDHTGKILWKCVVKGESDYDLYLLNYDMFFSDNYFTIPTTRGRAENIDGKIWGRTGVNILRLRLTE